MKRSIDSFIHSTCIYLWRSGELVVFINMRMRFDNCTVDTGQCRINIHVCILVLCWRFDVLQSFDLADGRAHTSQTGPHVSTKFNMHQASRQATCIKLKLYWMRNGRSLLGFFAFISFSHKLFQVLLMVCIKSKTKLAQEERQIRVLSVEK